MDYPLQGEDKLIELSKEGDHRAFKELVDRNQNTVARVVMGILGNGIEAEDVGQEVFIKLYEALRKGKFRKRAKLETYLTRIAINLAINETKKVHKKKSSNEEEPGSKYEDPSTDKMKAMEDQELIDKALAQLPPDQRSVVVLRLVQGYDTNETAEILNIPSGTVLSRSKRGQEKLKKLLKPIIFKDHGR